MFTCHIIVVAQALCLLIDFALCPPSKLQPYTTYQFICLALGVCKSLEIIIHLLEMEEHNSRLQQPFLMHVPLALVHLHAVKTTEWPCSQVGSMSTPAFSVW